jgi:hypothetical protein
VGVGTEQAGDARFIGKDADGGAAYHLLVVSLDGIQAVKLQAALPGEGRVGEDVVLGGIHAGP